MSLVEYRRKRDFTKTAEPKGRGRRSHKTLAFVVHKHAARRLHYDLRLEWNGALKSWAVPRGPSLDPAVRSLAVQVEDHPLEYGEFEGAIPEGEYGAGSVIVWDRGTWTPLNDAESGLRKGKLEFELHGEKLRGAFHLVRMKSDGERNWLLIKSKDSFAQSKSAFDVVEQRPASVASGRTIEEIGSPKAKAKAGKRRRRATKGATFKFRPDELSEARPAEQPDWIAPQLAKLVTEAPGGDDWVHEIKYDGYRLLAVREGGEVRLLTRNCKDWTDNFSRVARAVAELPVRGAILDGEVCVLDEHGRSDFQALQNALQRDAAGRMYYFLFDLPFLDGYDLRRCTLQERKTVLAELLSQTDTGSPLRFSEHVIGNGPRTLEEVCRQGLEGIVSKRAASPYESRRSASWLKVKCSLEQEFVIGGFTDPKGGRKGFGALLVGVHEGGRLTYAGRVGTGFDETRLRDMAAELAGLEQRSSAFANPPVGASARGVHWVKPVLVAQVKYRGMTSDGILRHAVFDGLRADKKASEVTRELPAELPTAARRARRASGSTVAGVTLSNPDRILFSEAAVTKAELATYYETVGQAMLRFLADRPLMLVRCPDGVDHTCFHQKHPASPVPATLRAVPVREGDGVENYLVADTVAGLVSLTQVSAVEIHTWGSRARDLEHPDRVIFDLDPGEGVGWERLAEAANTVRTLLEQLDLKCFAKTTGGKGVHVVAPLRPSATWEQTKEFARVVAGGIVRSDPKGFVEKMTKSLRKGRIYVDYLRNGRGATCVEAFSTRAKPLAPVSVPVSWAELPRRKSSADFTVRNVESWLTRARSAWRGYFDHPPSLSKKLLAKLGID